MPLVTNNQDAISVAFQAQADQLIAESNRVIAKVEEVKKDTQATNAALVKSAKEADAAARKNTMSWTDFRSMYQTVLDVVRVGKAVWEETGQKYVDNAVLVGNLARAMGTTTEEASRLKEVADDVGISVDSLKTSMKLALKDGFEPNIDGLARMSDEYLKLAPGTERMQYLLDRFGKSGEEMGKILEKGGDSIRDMAAAMDDGLIVTQKAYEEARRYQISVDGLKDSWDALTYKAAPPLVAALTEVVNATNDTIRAREIAKEQGENYYGNTDKFLELAAAEREEATAALLAADAAQDASGAFETEAESAKRLAEETKATEQAIKDMTDANKIYLDQIESVSDRNKDYEKSIKEIDQAFADGKISIDERQDKLNELAATHELAMHKMMLNMLELELAEGGLDRNETAFLLDQGKAWGIYSDTAIAEMRDAQRQVDILTAKYRTVPALITTTVQTNYVTTGYGAPMMTNPGGTKGRAAGGPIMAGNPYLVGERGPEVVIPSQNANVVSNSKSKDMFAFDYKKMGKEVARAVATEFMRSG